MAAQQGGGDDAVGQKQAGDGHQQGKRRRDAFHQRVGQIAQGQGEAAPEKGKEQADPSVQVGGQAGVIPETDAAHLVIEEINGVFHRCGRHCAVKEQRHRMGAYCLGQNEDSEGAEAVNGAQGQEKKAFSGLIGRVSDSGIELFQQKAHKAVKKKIPEKLGHRWVPPFG